MKSMAETPEVFVCCFFHEATLNPHYDPPTCFFLPKGHPQIYTDCMFFFIAHPVDAKAISPYFSHVLYIPGWCWIFFIFEIQWGCFLRPQWEVKVTFWDPLK